MIFLLIKFNRQISNQHIMFYLINRIKYIYTYKRICVNIVLTRIFSIGDTSYIVQHQNEPI